MSVGKESRDFTYPENRLLKCPEICQGGILLKFLTYRCHLQHCVPHTSISWLVSTVHRFYSSQSSCSVMTFSGNQTSEPALLSGLIPWIKPTSATNQTVSEIVELTSSPPASQIVRHFCLAFSDVPMSGKTNSRDFTYPENRLLKCPEIWNYDHPIAGYGIVFMPDDSQ